MFPSDDKDLKKDAVERIDGIPTPTTPQRRGYQPATDEERKLDKKINMKLDCFVIVILALDFLVSVRPFSRSILLTFYKLQGIDKGNIGNAATSKSTHDT